MTLKKTDSSFEIGAFSSEICKYSTVCWFGTSKKRRLWGAHPKWLFKYYFNHAVRNRVLDFVSRRQEPSIPDFTIEIILCSSLAFSMPKHLPQQKFLLFVSIPSCAAGTTEKAMANVEALVTFCLNSLCCSASVHQM